MRTPAITVILVLAMLGVGGYWYWYMRDSVSGDRQIPEATTEEPGKLKVIHFSGTLEEVNTGCYADGECFVMVDGKHITTLRGWTNSKVGTADMDALHASIGKAVDVYAKDQGDGTYTLYGNSGFYVKVK